MAIDPKDNVNLKVKSLPYDENNARLSAMVAAIVSGGEIIGYLPLKATDNSDGTASLALTTTVQPDIDIGNIHLLDLTDTKINPATKEKQDAIITAINAISTGGVDPVGLKNVAATPINPATEDTLALIRGQTDNLTFTGPSLDVNVTGGLGISPVISTANSSTTPLGSGGIFTGTFEDILNFAHLTVQVFADQLSAVDGLMVEWSSDGVNVDDTDSFNIPANNGKIYTFGPQAKFFRIIYTNGVTAQGAFRLHVIKKPFTQKPSSHRIQDTIISDDDAELVKSVLTGEDGSGNFVNVKVTSAGSLLTSQEAAPGEIPINRYVRVIVNSHPSILVTYTVPAGKEFILTDWHVATQGAITLTVLEVDGVEMDSLRFTASNDTRRIAGLFSEKSGIAAIASQEVRIRTITGDTAKEWTVGFNGIERLV